MATLVDRPEQLNSLVDHLPRGSTYCMDTEFDSRAGKITLCLLQLRAHDETFLIDSLALKDLSPLAPALGHPDAVWVLHGAHQDIPLLLSALRIPNPPQLFDTQIAWGLVSPEPATSFAYLTYKLLGCRNSKYHQTDDWTRRPLSESQIAYAAHDVDSLPRMYDILLTRVTELGRKPAVFEACYENLCKSSEAWEPISVESYRNAWQLEPAGQVALSELINWYNGLTPSERETTIEAKLLWSLANRLPQTPEALRQVRGVPHLRAPHQERILSIVRGALQKQQPVTNLLEPPPYATFKRLQLDAWVEYVRTMACSKAQVSKELVLAGRQLRQMKEVIAQEGLDVFAAQSLIKLLAPWQYSLIGEALTWAAQRISAPDSLL